MNLQEYLEQVKSNPKTSNFDQTIALIDEYYQFTPAAFKNGAVYNEAGSNNGSCKIFALGLLKDLNEETTLALFGKHYFDDVLKHPEGEGHQNIRNFMKSGWSGIAFNTEALQPKK
ncbi:HopJ type III effector protein [Zunongwangia endophytica]|uniref:HopJ type III effector protein n=1 Tax=Zunongwangia endophytica TaxID=1808945 RepID=A0ABV8H305_9FLAO|nr:HopJ type III effector protein [Zunongwangia endophytica]MDN3596035.1 HopJ type III effector protein [Zunongwangia endophytica]